MLNDIHILMLHCLLQFLSGYNSILTECFGKITDFTSEPGLQCYLLRLSADCSKACISTLRLP